MARGRLPLIPSAALLFIVLIQFQSPGIFADPAPLLRSDGGRPAMILPLVLSAPNSSRPPRSEFHRRLQGSEPGVSDARMRLYDDLLSNGYLICSFFIRILVLSFGFVPECRIRFRICACLKFELFVYLSLCWFFLCGILGVWRYYTTRLWIGTPPQEFALIVDSGSTVTYVPCFTCKHCGNHQVWIMQLPIGFLFEARITMWGNPIFYSLV